MQYVITNNNQVIFGPKEWNRILFRSVLLENNVNTSLEYLNDSNSPIIVNENFSILPVTQSVIPRYNNQTQVLSGPFWTINSGVSATQTYNAVDKPVQHLKNELIEKVVATRYQNEIAGTTININGNNLNISTDRQGKQIYFQKASITTTEPINFKIGNAFYLLQQSDFQTICNAINAHVQTAFDWEHITRLQLNSANTISELLSVNINYPN